MKTIGLITKDSSSERIIVGGNILKRGWFRSAGLLAATVAIGWAAGAAAQTVPTDPQVVASLSPAVFNSWFQSGTASLDGVVNPANSVTFPATPNFSFYAWSEQMFLWLTSPAPPVYGGGGRIFDSPTFFEVSPLDASQNRTFIPHTAETISRFNLRASQVGPHGLPVLIDKQGRMLELENAAQAPKVSTLKIRGKAGLLVTAASARREENGKITFLDSSSKAIEPRLFTPALSRALVQPGAPIRVQKFLLNNVPIFLDGSGNVIDVEPNQAFGEVLLAQNGSPIYYTLLVNDVYAYFLTGVKDHQITPGTEFPTTMQDLSNITAFASGPVATAAGKAKSFNDPAALAVEVKTSWIEAAGLPNLNTYITKTATIPTFDKTNPAKWVPNGEKTVQLALVGIHVVGSVNQHTEMIWATFEHVGNSPDAAYSYINTAGNVVNVPQNTAGTWLFCSNNAAGPFNINRNQVDGSGDIVPLPGQSIGASDTIRWKAWGAASDVSPNPIDGTAAASNSEIIAINNSVRGMLPTGDVRANYIFKGATWTFGGPPTAGNQVGTSQLSNTTMETYQQGADTTAGNNHFNCFMCHTSNASNGTVISHIFPTPGLKPLF